MSFMSPDHISRAQRLTPREQKCLIAIGVVCLVLAALLLWSPPRSSSQTQRGQQIVETTIQDSQPTGVVVLLAGAGMAFILLALNGLRLSKFAFGPVSGEMPNDVEQFAKKLENEQKFRDPVEEITGDLTPTQEKAPAPEEDAAITANFGGNDKIGVYLLEQVPVAVLFDLIQEWEQVEKTFAGWTEREKQKPYDFSDFALAARRKGSGNHSWLITFKTRPPVWVSYGYRSGDKSTILTPAKNE
ncbi:MAG: hypothetical protein L0Y70_08215 [Gemmataceae bacterium]|nr:hypothetical protein [Gemmataceae bacterium]